MKDVHSTARAAPRQVPEGVLRAATPPNGETLDELYRHCRSRLYKCALRVTGNHEDAEDAVQDGVLAAFRSLNRFEGRSQFSTWLTRIVVNAALMRQRHNNVLRMVSIDAVIERSNRRLSGLFRDPRPNPEELYARRERLQRIDQAIRTTPETYRQMLRLYHVQGMSIKQAAEAIGLAPGTFKAQLHRARHFLRERAAEDRRGLRAPRSANQLALAGTSPLQSEKSAGGR